MSCLSCEMEEGERWCLGVEEKCVRGEVDVGGRLCLSWGVKWRREREGCDLNGKWNGREEEV